MALYGIVAPSKDPEICIAILSHHMQNPCPFFCERLHKQLIQPLTFSQKIMVSFGTFPRNPMLQGRGYAIPPCPGRGSRSEGWRLCDGHRSGGAAGGHQSRLCHPLPQPRGERCSGRPQAAWVVGNQCTRYKQH